MEDFIIYAIDFEGSRQTGILEYGIVGLSAQQGIFSTESKLCKNKTYIPLTEMHCHGLSANHLLTKIDFSNYLNHFLQLRSKAFFCAHNAIFENTLLSDYCPITSNAYSLHKMQTQQWGPWIDTYILYKKFFKNKSYSLNELIKNFQLGEILSTLGKKFCPHTRNNFHCALFDAIACALLLLNFIRNVKSNTITLTWLLEQSTPTEIAKNIRQPQLWD